MAKRKHRVGVEEKKKKTKIEWGAQIIAVLFAFIMIAGILLPVVDYYGGLIADEWSAYQSQKEAEAAAETAPPTEGTTVETAPAE